MIDLHQSDIEELQALADQLAEEYPNHHRFYIERRGSEYWAISEDTRYWGDDGECLGGDLDVALAVLEAMY